MDNPLDFLLSRPPTDSRDPQGWATVTQVSPLRIRLDGEAAPLDITPMDLGGGSRAVSDRVFVIWLSDSTLRTAASRLLVIGPSVSGVTAEHTVLYVDGGLLDDQAVPAAPGQGFGEVAFTPTPGRLYEVTWRPPQMYTDLGGTTSTAVDITYTTNGTRPLVGSTKLRRQQFHLSVGSVFGTPPEVKQQFMVAEPQVNPWRFLGVLTRLGEVSVHTRNNGTDYSSQWWKITDLGPRASIPGTLVANTGL